MDGWSWLERHDVGQHEQSSQQEIFAPLRALDLPVGYTITVPGVSRPVSSRKSNAGPASLATAARAASRDGKVWLYLNRVRPVLESEARIQSAMRQLPVGPFPNRSAT